MIRGSMMMRVRDGGDTLAETQVNVWPDGRGAIGLAIRVMRESMNVPDGEWPTEVDVRLPHKGYHKRFSSPAVPSGGGADALFVDQVFDEMQSIGLVPCETCGVYGHRTIKCPAHESENELRTIIAKRWPGSPKVTGVKG